MTVGRVVHLPGPNALGPFSEKGVVQPLYRTRVSAVDRGKDQLDLALALDQSRNGYRRRNTPY
jgi:hypothetical protein